MFRFANYIFLLNLVRYVLTSRARMQRAHTTAGLFLDSFCFEFPFKLLFLATCTFSSSVFFLSAILLLCLYYVCTMSVCLYYVVSLYAFVWSMLFCI